METLESVSEKPNKLLELMTFDQIELAIVGQALRIVTMDTNGWKVKGQALVLTCPEGCKPLCRYICIESGKGNSVWRFDRELWY